MKPDPSALSPRQRQFLAVLLAAGKPVSGELIGRLAPVSQHALTSLLHTENSPGWVTRTESHGYRLADGLSPECLAGLKQTLSAGLHHEMVETADSLAPPTAELVAVRAALMHNAGMGLAASESLWKHARDRTGKESVVEAMNLLEQAAEILQTMADDHEKERLASSVALDLSNLSYSIGKGIEKAMDVLKTAGIIAHKVGNERSYALIRLHRGRLLHVSGRHPEALAELSEGLKGVKSLGDMEIQMESAGFLGLYFYIQGMFKEAMTHLERGLYAFESGKSELPRNPSAPVLFGYCAAYLGQFHRAAGALDCSLRIARRQNDRGLAAILMAVLGTILVLGDRDRAAEDCLARAMNEAEQLDNALAMYLACGGKAFQLFRQKSLEKAHAILKQAAAVGLEAGFINQYSSPWVLEMIFEFEKIGLFIPGFEFKKELARIFKGSNLHLKGVGMRLRASAAIAEGADNEEVSSLLSASVDLLQRTGDPVEAAKSMFDAGRLHQESGRNEEAKQLAKTAWQTVAELQGPMIPDDLQHLIPARPEGTSQFIQRSFLIRALTVMEEIAAVESIEEILPKALVAAARMFKAERGALFRFSENNLQTPELLASIHLSADEIEATGFRPSMEMIKRSFKEKKPLSGWYAEPGDGATSEHARLCLPVFDKDEPRAVLYYDAIYLSDGFFHPDREAAERLARHISSCYQVVRENLQLKNDKMVLNSVKSLLTENRDREGIIGRDKAITQLLSRADQVADSDLTVLLQGETGVGKELFARRIHKMSRRSNGPYVEVDLTGIPETLLESELFGHEKGAFTGATSRKRGRLELAHHGTAFFDEIGEISLSMQVKLLRVLQEKAFVRVGGMRTIRSDFRLVVATNRNLEKEVAAGRFRRDLYYRLNVVPLSIPPLRKRKQDIVMLANHFMKRYAAKYKCGEVRLKGRDKQRLTEYSWPGNVRELKNIFERAVILSRKGPLRIDLPAEFTDERQKDVFSGTPTLDEIQRKYIQYVLKKTGGKLSGPGGAVEILGIKRQTLYARMKKLGLH